MTTGTEQWKDVVARKRNEQASSIPKDWNLTELPSKDTLDVMDFPDKCGLLSSKEKEITNSEVTTLLEKLAKGVWTAVEVTTAFAKRAIIAQQLVRSCPAYQSSHGVSQIFLIGQLPDRNIYRSCFSPCDGVR